MKNKQFLLASRPVGTPTRKNWDFVENDVADLLDNQVLVQVEFISLDQPQKVRGRKRDLLFVNEGNELYYEDMQQLLFRTQDRIILDFNPSDEYHWIYDKLIARDDCDFFKTTYGF